MARFLGTAAGRSAGGGGGGGLFTKAKVFTTAGSSTFDVPGNASTVKVFVVGAGSCYRPGLYCFNSTNCCSGVSYPRRYYNACFCGHLTGAGGGYAEKTWTSKDDQIGGKQLTVIVGSPGGTSSSSVDGAGLNAVTATNATESAYTWACTSNSTARDNTNDNPIFGGFKLPTCGYQNNFNGYNNDGGSASGGDINRTGGEGELIPEFLYDAKLDAYSTDTGGGSSSGTTGTNSCWVSPSICCMCWRAYHQVFGSHCYWQAWCCDNCTCYYLCANISSMCYCVPGGGSNPARAEVQIQYRGKAAGGVGSCGGWCNASNSFEETFNDGGRKFPDSCGPVGIPPIAPGNNTMPDASLEDETWHTVPIGMGAQSGYSAGNGAAGRTEGIIADVTPRNDQKGDASGAGGSGSEMQVTCGWNSSYGYDYSFGGSAVHCGCFMYYPGVHSSCQSKTASCGAGSNPPYCYSCTGFGWTYVFGSCQSTQAMCWKMPYGSTSVDSGGGADCVYKTCYNVGFLHDPESNAADTYTIPLSTLLNADTDGNQEDFIYGRGATLDKAAGYGGGGNREYKAGGSGAVVIVYG
tara:strand:+ start:4739 stop:6469 length:1731 start_codon:yes stop_codon:yes gene_type:complete